MYNKISVKITMILIMTAALAVPSSVLQLSHAQGDLQNTILNTHNQERAAVGVAPLTWSDSLAANATVCGQSAFNRPVHKIKPTQRAQAMVKTSLGPRQYFTTDELAQGWYQKSRIFNRATF